MVLEEEIYFSNQDIAREFTRKLKELGISSQIRQKLNLDIRLMLSGTYTRLSEMLDEVIGQQGASEEEVELFSQTKEHLISQRDLIAQAFETYQVGDRIGSGLMDIITGDRTIEGDENEEKIEEIIEEIYLTRLLHLNELLEVGEGGLYLTKKVDPNEATLTIFADEIPVITDDILKTHEIKSTITAGDDEEWKVTVGPEIIFLEDITPIEEFFEENDIGEEEMAEFFPKIQIKQILVSEIFSMVQQNGSSSRDEIKEKLAERDFETGADGQAIALHVSKEFIDATIDDLKKAGVIKGKDQKLRIVH